MSIDQMLNLNINAVIKNVQSVIPHMIEQGGGDIIVTSSLAGRSAIKHEPVYSASKFAITCFTQTTRRQVNKHGIRVAQVSPGPVISALLDDWPTEKLEARQNYLHASNASALLSTPISKITRLLKRYFIALEQFRNARHTCGYRGQTRSAVKRTIRTAGTVMAWV